MKHLKLIMTVSLSLALIAVIAASYSLFLLYNYEKDKTMAIVRECAENADILEIISRMESSERADQAFVRLNAYMEVAQSKDGIIANSDTLGASLASLLRFGLEFPDGKTTTDYDVLDSIFRAELNRHSLYPSIATIKLYGTDSKMPTSLWSTQVYVDKATDSTKYNVYVSPMPGKVLSHMWGIIIPFCIVIAIFSLLSLYLNGVIRRLKKLDEMKDDFTHNMTHELKTPISVAYSAADSMLRYYDHSDEYRNKQFLNIILQRLSFLSGMIENILSMSMERFKTIKLKKENIQVKAIVKEVSEMMKLKSDKPISFDIEIADNLTVLSDSIHFGNVLSNLIENAIKYSGSSVDITITADEHSLTIADNGIGIDKENLPYIFDKFYRVTSGDRYEVGGYGLGLYYVKQIMRLFGWTIDVKSKPGKGTKFELIFSGNE